MVFRFQRVDRTVKRERKKKRERERGSERGRERQGAQGVSKRGDIHRGERATESARSKQEGRCIQRDIHRQKHIGKTACDTGVERERTERYGAGRKGAERGFVARTRQTVRLQVTRYVLNTKRKRHFV